MNLLIIFSNGKVGNIQRDALEHLIAEKKIVAFRRSDGWVQVDRDPTRMGPHLPTWAAGSRWSDFPLQRTKL
jgi:hypothetical protein